MEWVGCIRCEKFQNDFMAQTCALIAPVQPILHRVSCSNETLPNAPKHYETHQNMSLWSNGVDRVCSLRKIPMRFHGANLWINCTQILWGTPKHEFRVQWGGSILFIAKNSDATLWHKLVHWLHQFNPFCTKFHVVTEHWQIHPNTTKCTKTWV